MTIRLGQEVRDRVTGFKGFAVCKTEWLNGCVRWGLQAPIDKDGKFPDTVSVDEQQLEVVNTAHVLAVPEPAEELSEVVCKVGGPYPEPKRAEAPR